MNTALISIFDTNSSVHDPSDLILFFLLVLSPGIFFLHWHRNVILA